MTLRYFLLILILIPTILFGQNNYDTSNCKISIDEIYSIIKVVIEKENLNKQYGIDIDPYKNNNINYSDENYLQTLLIKPVIKDKSELKDTSAYVVASQISYPNKNIFTQADINYILCSQISLQQFKWDNERLKFNLANDKNYYRFSLPFFSLTHNKVVIKYEFLCPGLCGNGKSILLIKNDKGWNATNLEFWMH